MVNLSCFKRILVIRQETVDVEAKMAKVKIMDKEDGLSQIFIT